MEEKLEQIFQELIEDDNIQILYVEFEKEGGYNYLRVFLEKKDGTKVSLDDCEKVSLKISDIADKEIKSSFMLEVSSPGIERKLKKEEHFRAYIGHKINVKTISNIQNSKKFEGILTDVKDQNILIEDEKIGNVEIAISKIKKAMNIYDFSSIKGLEEK